MLSELIERFAKESPTSVMMRGLLEHVFRPERLDQIFETHAKIQYQRELLFSSLVNLLSLVVCGIQPSVNAAYRKKAVELNVTRNAVYEKLNGVELQVSRALLKETGSELSQLIDKLGGKSRDLLPGYEIRILDGNGLAASERRLKVLRDVGSAPLPGKSLVVIDPVRRLAVDIFPCEDGHAQEQRLFTQVLESVEAHQLWMADRNMCTQQFLCQLAAREAKFVIREHKSLPQTLLGQEVSAGKVEAGKLFEQFVEIQFEGEVITARRVILRLFKPTRHGDLEIVVLTNLSQDEANAAIVTQLYRERWRIEKLFLSVTMNFEGEIKTLAYPKAALFSFTLALISYNILAVLKASLASVHGVEKVESSLSDFYLVEELQGVYRGMMIAIPSEHWEDFRHLSLDALVLRLKELARRVNLKLFAKQPRKKLRPRNLFSVILRSPMSPPLNFYLVNN